MKEARVAGLAIITTKAGGQAQYVEDGKSGIFYDFEDSESLVEAVLSLSSDRETANDMGQYQKSLYQDLLEPSRTAQEFVGLYRRLVSNT